MKVYIVCDDEGKYLGLTNDKKELKQFGDYEYYYEYEVEGPSIVRKGFGWRKN